MKRVLMMLLVLLLAARSAQAIDLGEEEDVIEGLAPNAFGGEVRLPW